MARKTRGQNEAPVSLAAARRAVDYLDAHWRESEDERAQSNLIETLSAYEGILEDAQRRSKRRHTRSDAKEFARTEAWVKRNIRDAERRAKRPTIYGRRVSGEAIGHSSATKTVPSESRHLAGVRCFCVHSAIGGKRSSSNGPIARSEVATLRGSNGAILAQIIVAGAEREIYAQLLRVLMDAAPHANGDRSTE